MSPPRWAVGEEEELMIFEGVMESGRGRGLMIVDFGFWILDF